MKEILDRGHSKRSVCSRFGLQKLHKIHMIGPFEQPGYPLLKRVLDSCLVLFLFFSFACQKKTDTATMIRPADKYQVMAKAMLAIERLRSNPDVNWEEIENQYTLCLPVVREIDTKNKTTYELEIADALQQCKNGDKPAVHQQYLAKGLQHIAVLSILNEIQAVTSTRDPAALRSAAGNIAHIFEGIRPTFTRRDADYFDSTKTLEAEADDAISTIMNLAKSGSSFITPARKLDDTILRTYALCVLYELKGIEQARETDLDLCEKKQAEATVFYRIIMDRIKKTSRDSHLLLSAMLSADYAMVDSKKAEDSLADGLRGIVLYGN